WRTPRLGVGPVPEAHPLRLLGLGTGPAGPYFRMDRAFRPCSRRARSTRLADAGPVTRQGTGHRRDGADASGTAGPPGVRELVASSTSPAVLETAPPARWAGACPGPDRVAVGVTGGVGACRPKVSRGSGRCAALGTGHPARDRAL